MWKWKQLLQNKFLTEGHSLPNCETSWWRRLSQAPCKARLPCDLEFKRRAGLRNPGSNWVAGKIRLALCRSAEWKMCFTVESSHRGYQWLSGFIITGLENYTAFLFYGMIHTSGFVVLTLQKLIHSLQLKFRTTLQTGTPTSIQVQNVADLLQTTSTNRKSAALMWQLYLLQNCIHYYHESLTSHQKPRGEK